jgi:hypothetical protein
MSSRSNRTRNALVGLVALSFALVVGACSAPAAPSSPPSAPTAPGMSAGTTAGTTEQGVAAVAPGAPAVAPGIVGSGPATSTGAGVASSGSAIAYPYYGGAPAVAPEHTIVVTGYGQATMAADGADRSKAQSKALAAALADAREQADAIAKATGVTITGVYSVSASGGGYGYAVPMAVNGSTGAAVPPVVTTDPSAGTVAGGAPATPPEPAPGAPTTLDFGMSVTVAYSISG